MPSAAYTARTFTLQVPPNWPFARYTLDPRSGDETIRWTNPERTLEVTVTASTRPIASLLPDLPGVTTLDDVYGRIVRNAAPHRFRAAARPTLGPISPAVSGWAREAHSMACC
ncbi:MAG: hypothetical protein ACR2M0_11285 [Chloroflexia bacterium]